MSCKIDPMLAAMLSGSAILTGTVGVGAEMRNQAGGHGDGGNSTLLISNAPTTRLPESAQGVGQHSLS